MREDGEHRGAKQTSSQWQRWMNHRSAPGDTSALNTRNASELRPHRYSMFEHIVLYVR